MKRFLLGVLAGMIIAGVSAVVLFFATLKFAGRTPSTPDKFMLVVRLAGDLPEVSATALPFPWREEKTPLTIAELYRVLPGAAGDARVAGVLLLPSGSTAGWGKADEIREGVAALRAAKKPVYAWLQTPNLREYYMAAGATKVFVAPEDFADVKGLRLEAAYFKGTLDKIGVQFEVEHAGRYKDAGDVFTRTSMTPETRESLNAVLDGLYQRIVAGLAQSRGKSPEQMRALLDQGPFLAPKAKELGLVDDLLYERQARETLAEAAGVRVTEVIDARRYLESGAGGGARGAKRVALLVAQGDILRFSNDSLLGEDQAITPSAMGRLVRRVGDDASIAGVILRVDSPGGDALASDEILYALRGLSKKKPLVISMSDTAASGGYYIAMTGDPVIAYHGTITGSIGVVFGKVNVKGLYEKLGISAEILKRGANADIDSALMPMTPEARRKIREGVDFVYEGFLKRVAEGRKKPVAEIAPVAEGRVWLGSDALARGLVDELGGLTAAVNKVKEKAGIPAKERVALVVYPEKRTLFQQLMQREEEASSETPVSIKRQLLKEAGPGVAPWLAGGYLRSLPVRLEFR